VEPPVPLPEPLVIDLPKEFDFAANLAYMQRNAKECMYAIDNGTITRALEIDGERLLIGVSAAENRQLLVRFLAGTPVVGVESYIRDWFDLGTDLAPFYEMAQGDPLLQSTIEDHYGLRNIGLPDLFEALCWGILGQQINLGYAYTLKRQFVEKFGESLEYRGVPYWIFPSFEKIAAMSPEDMSDIKMTVKKSEYIIGVARLMASGELSKEGLLALGSLSAIEKELVRIRGIGPWTANYVLLRCLRFPDAFPVDDAGLINAIKYQLGLDRKPTKAEILELAVPWENWKAYATFYLWRVLY
jgi:DNA-3-methyladenine glycosylase II